MGMVIYIASIALQVSGALILLSSALSVKRATVIKQYLQRSSFPVMDCETKIIGYNHDAFSEEFRSIYTNRVAFGYISSGYLLGLWGESIKNHRLTIFLWVVLSSVVLFFAAKLLIDHLCRKVGKITFDEILQLKLEKNVLRLNDSCDESSDS